MALTHRRRCNQGGIVAEFGRIARTDGLNTVTPQHLWCWENASEIDKGKKSYPCHYPAVMNWVMLYGFADWAPQEQIKVLDGAHRYGLKILYDLSRRGIASNFNGGPITNATGIEPTVAHWLTANISVVKDHPALLGYYICVRCNDCSRNASIHPKCQPYRCLQDDCCGGSSSAQALVYSFIKDLDP